MVHGTITSRGENKTSWVFRTASLMLLQPGSLIIKCFTLNKVYVGKHPETKPPPQDPSLRKCTIFWIGCNCVFVFTGSLLGLTRAANALCWEESLESSLKCIRSNCIKPSNYEHGCCCFLKHFPLMKLSKNTVHRVMNRTNNLFCPSFCMQHLNLKLHGNMLGGILWKVIPTMENIVKLLSSGVHKLSPCLFILAVAIYNCLF